MSPYKTWSAKSTYEVRNVSGLHDGYLGCAFNKSRLNSHLLFFLSRPLVCSEPGTTRSKQQPKQKYYENSI